MEALETGDVIAYHLAGNVFGLAHIVQVEDLATTTHYHLVILDAADPIELDEVNPEESIVEHFAGRLEAPRDIAVDHLSVTPVGMEQSGALRVGAGDVEDFELIGYQIWLHGTAERLLQQGVLRDDLRARPAQESDGDEEQDGDDDGADYDLVDGEQEPDDGAAEATDARGDASADGAGALERREIQMRPWHGGTLDRAVGPALFEWREEVIAANPEGGRLVEFLTSVFDEGIASMGDVVRRFIEEGDYAAGQELAQYGDAAGDRLAAYLRDDMDPQLAEDILNILSDMGTLRAYDHIATFFAAHGGRPSDPLEFAAVRGYCYAVMLTGGTPEPLRRELHRLDAVDDPDLRDDLKNAREAIVQMPEAETPSPSASMNAPANPFGLGG